MKEGIRVSIIGAGIIGLTTAYRLLQEKEHIHITIYEKDKQIKGATRFAGAIDIPFYQTEYHKDLVKFSWSWYNEHANHSDFRKKCPIIWHIQDTNNTFSIQAHLLDNIKHHKNRMSYNNEYKFYHTYLGESFVINPIAWCNEIKKRLIESGKVTILENCHVENIAFNHSYPTLTVNSKKYSFDHCIISAGPWVNSLHEKPSEYTKSINVRNKKVCALRLQLMDKIDYAIADPLNGIFLFPHHNTGSYAMSIKFDDYNVNPDIIPDTPSEVLDIADHFLNSIFGKNKWNITKECIFMDTYNPEFCPVVTSLPDFNKTATIITGTHGSGIRLSPGLANEAVKLCLSSID